MPAGVHEMAPCAATAAAYTSTLFKVILSTLFPLPSVQPAELLTDLQETQNV